VSLLVTKIQPYSINDGPGIRTTVFLKGCSLQCPWCANPETQSKDNEIWFDEEKCIGKSNPCLLNLGCTHSFSELSVCPLGALSYVATEYSCIELESILLKDKPYWKNGGGITFSGGEPLLQINSLEPLLIPMRDKKVDIWFETALNVQEENVCRILRYASGLYCDMKSLIESDFSNFGGNVELYMKNLGIIDASAIPYIIRIPLVKPYTYNEENLNRIKEYLSKLNPTVY
jgi:glycyl-radical enzyme activating protein family